MQAPPASLTHIDEKWLNTTITPSFLSCLICKQLHPPSLLMECSSCCILVCTVDYIKMGSIKKCPGCKTCPWLTKKELDPLYKKAFDLVRLKCQLCPPETKETYNYIIFWEHMAIHHPKTVQVPSVCRHKLTHYELVHENQEQKSIQLTELDQVYLNECARSGKLKCVILRDPFGHSIHLDLGNKAAKDHTGKYTIVTQPNKSLQPKKPYALFVLLDILGQSTQRPDADSHAQILNAYKEYLKNKKLNQINIRLKFQLLRVDFGKMTVLDVKANKAKHMIYEGVVFDE